ncbi:MAG: aldo/keto reductase [Coriobacteriales bacterium]|jgi:predicted aldo/keto reductase-like oxidoreductase
MGDYFGSDVGKLGFGLMRLPRRGVRTDIDEFSAMVDEFLAAGLTYFDTAPLYPGSEAATRKALVKRYPRESYTIATKLNAFLLAHSERGAKKQIDASIAKLGCGYIDYYLLHSIMNGNCHAYERYHTWEWGAELKRQGRIRYFGFSFHAGPDLLDRLLTAHPEIDFVQLQLNYADWERKSVSARANYEVARSHNKSIVVMEPLKGGTLANPGKEVRALFDRANPNASYASWGIRFAASLDGVITVLSGMSNLEQMRDNLSYMRDFKPLSSDERAVIRKAQELMELSSAIPCTACRYCTGGCPKHIQIPDILAAMNERTANGQIEESAAAYKRAAAAGSPASACLKCGKCEDACPQHIQIISELEKCARTFEG